MWYVIYYCTLFNIKCAVLLYISAWAILALLVQTSVGNAKAFDTWDGVTGTDSRAFSFYMG